MAEHHPELDGNTWNILETTVSYKNQARLTPTLTHVVMYKLVTSGAGYDTMSCTETSQIPFSVVAVVDVHHQPLPSFSYFMNLRP